MAAATPAPLAADLEHGLRRLKLASMRRIACCLPGLVGHDRDPVSMAKSRSPLVASKSPHLA
jgi:hypothetical protein